MPAESGSMMKEMSIRHAVASDDEAISALTARAFAGHPHSDGSEPEIIARLRAAKALTLSLVAEMQHSIVGHVAFSPAGNSGGAEGWYALGPISVDPERQKQGIGRALIEAGMAMLEERGASGCILVGDPAYYTRFGFRVTPECCPPGIPAEYFMTAGLNAAPTGIFSFHPAFFGPVT